jgi:hypothetical protein
MAIEHELSSDVASAILAATSRSPRELSELKEIVLRVHSTLQELKAMDQHAMRQRQLVERLPIKNRTTESS